MAKNLERIAAPRDDHDLRLDPDLRAAAEAQDFAGLVALLSERSLAHGLNEGAGRSPAEIGERFLDARALPDAALGVRAADTLRGFLDLSADLADAPQALRDFSERRGVDFGEALASFSDRASAVAGRAPSAAIRFEAGFGRPLDYYTGLVFELRAEGVPAPVAGGGRYDRLMEMLGSAQPVPAVGFTMRLDLFPAEGGR
jgi:ATP phosphoribosyltransferase regulatory subunit